jgi:uncharacterized membrane protein
VEDKPLAVKASRSRAVDRLVNFSDAVVAVAVTVLVLPLVDIGPPGQGQTVWQLIGDNGAQIFAFVFTFYVVAIMWQAHNRILNGIRDYDPAVFWLNTTWLALIVMLPWFSAMYGESQSETEGKGASGVGLVYWGALAAISLLGSTISWHLVRNPALLVPGDRDTDRVGRMTVLRGPVFAGYFLFIGVVFEFAPAIATWLPLGIIPLSIWMRPRHQQQHA